MFIIFGWGFTTRHVFGAVYPVQCPNCHNERFWVLQRVRRWFTLFFIPVFPYESTHLLMCPVCGVGYQLHGADFKRAKMYAETNAAYSAGQLNDDEAARRIAAISSASDVQIRKGVDSVPAHQTPSVATIEAAPAACASDPSSVPSPSAIVATFNATCGWCGRAITVGSEGFVLEGYGPIDAKAVLAYDAQGYLEWADDGQGALVGRLAGEAP